MGRWQSIAVGWQFIRSEAAQCNTPNPDSLMPYVAHGRQSHKMKQRQNTHAWSLVGEEAVAYSLVRVKAAAVTRESEEAAGCSLVREGRRRQSLTLGLGQRKNSELLCRSSCLQPA